MMNENMLNLDYCYFLFINIANLLLTDRSLSLAYKTKLGDS